MNLDEMTGSPNLIIVPDPATFRIPLPSTNRERRMLVPVPR